MALADVQKLMLQGLTEGIFTAAVLLVKLRDTIIFHDPFGTLGGEGTAQVKQDTLFDLASLTKVIATTPAWLILASRDPHILDQPLTRWFSDAPEDKAAITPRHLLAHISGLPAWRPYYLLHAGDTPRDLFTKEKILSEPLLYQPGESTLYSDLGFILLGFILEIETGKRLEIFTSEEIFGPLGQARNLMFLPMCDKDRTALTRKGDPPGVVNDLNARALGGVAGHAGLFGTAHGVAEVGSRILLSLKWPDSFFDKNATRLFCTKAQFGNPCTRPLGFDTPTPEGSSSGRFFSPASLGHTGFTGTSLWMDPERELIVVLLTNRVYAGESDFRIKEFRPLVHDAIVEEIMRA